MVVEVVDGEVEEVAGEVDLVVVVVGFPGVLAALPGFSSGMTIVCPIGEPLERMHAVGVTVAVAVDFELLDLGNHLSSVPDQFQRQTYWAALVC
jgi:undecaprenyl pyrophosphate phosphatase UppP